VALDEVSLVVDELELVLETVVLDPVGVGAVAPKNWNCSL